MATNEEGLQPPTHNLLPVKEADRASTENAGKVHISNDGTNLTVLINRERPADIRLTKKVHKLPKHLTRKAKLVLTQGDEEELAPNLDYEGKFKHILGQYSGVPRLNIAIHVVGSRGDVQPFIAIGQILTKPPYGHRVRICTHPVFKGFVEENGIEFFSIGGDPNSLMAYMVKNPGLLPGRESWKSGDVGKRRAEFAIILEGCWRGCIEAGNGMGDEKKGAGESVDAHNEDVDRCFIADAIIANPPSYGHIHCAEKLGIPLHMMFTMPWSPTQYFPHPLASLQGTRSDSKFANYMSYTAMEFLAWQGLGDVINGFRMKTLHLDAISPMWGYMLLARLRVPFTYTWSSALIPKPQDWEPHINITGFPFLKAGLNYHPPEDLVQFLKAGPPPVYIGFGSIVVENPEELTKVIFGAVKRAGVRALVSKGWGGLGQGDVNKDIFLLGNCPHDWLFQFVSCVVHHGGAGTSAIGIAMGKPTIVVPFFGDQPFWGTMIYRAGAGPEPVPFRSLTEEGLAESIKRALDPDIQASVKEMSTKISNESGSEDAAAAFSNSLDYDKMRCLICPEQVAIWRVKKTNVRLGPLAAATLAGNGIITPRQMTLNRHQDWYLDEGTPLPISGLLASVSDMVVKMWDNTHIYFHDVLETLRKEPLPREKRLQKLTRRSIDQNMGILNGPFPVQATFSYPPGQLERLAYKMASETLPDTKVKSKYTKMQPWIARMPTRMQTTSIRESTSDKKSKKVHGKIYEVGSETGHFAYTMMCTCLHAPVAVFYNVANGFHNAPNFMFNDHTVRKRDNISGFRSGVKVAGKGFVFNIYDGITGIVTHPYRDAKKDGIKGFGKGIGRGFGGLISKTMAAVFGVPGYTLKGVEKAIERRSDRDLKAEIIAVRLKQGLAAFRRASEEEKQEILKKWKELVTR